MPPRTGDVISAGGSVVAYQKWIDERESQDPAQSPILGRIRSYNKVDCESTVGLRDWLLDRQRENGIAWSPAKYLPRASASSARAYKSMAMTQQTRLSFPTTATAT